MFKIVIRPQPEKAGLGAKESYIDVYESRSFSDKGGTQEFLAASAHVSLPPGILMGALLDVREAAFNQGAQVGQAKAQAECTSVGKDLATCEHNAERLMAQVDELQDTISALNADIEGLKDDLY